MRAQLSACLREAIRVRGWARGQEGELVYQLTVDGRRRIFVHGSALHRTLVELFRTALELELNLQHATLGGEHRRV